MHTCLDIIRPTNLLTYLPTYARCGSTCRFFFLSHLGIHCIDGISRTTLSVRRKSWWDVFYVQLPQHYLLAGRFVKMLHIQILEHINSFRFFCWFWWRIQKFSSSHLNIPFLNARIQPTRRWWVCQFFPFSVVFACSWLSSFGQSSNILSRPGDRTKEDLLFDMLFYQVGVLNTVHPDLGGGDSLIHFEYFMWVETTG